MAGADDFDLLAASLRADAGDVDGFFEVLVAKLEEALPDQVEVERRGGLLGGRKRVHRIEVTLGDQRYEARARARAVTLPSGARSCGASRSRPRSSTSTPGSLRSRRISSTRPTAANAGARRSRGCWRADGAARQLRSQRGRGAAWSARPA